ncbi:uncharacterized protein L969DRAFT_34403, partial [Mixia osmundae IAM 14324]|uniref:uncharacterized protein n=1 Tax=Mixia osmundae (strain CBS 9802 / IAM 14324 / JCM 22182 / KY 12970) TaxID=764103 RepID=UPI0004A558C3
LQSGFGYTGGRSRCHPFWQGKLRSVAEFTKCYSQADEPLDCLPQKEDYLECLHHKKEIARAQTIKQTYLSHQGKEVASRKAEAEVAVGSGIISSLGLLDTSKDEEEPE